MLPVAPPYPHRSTSNPGIEVLRWDYGGGKEGGWGVCSEDLSGPAANGQRDIHAYVSLDGIHRGVPLWHTSCATP